MSIFVNKLFNLSRNVLFNPLNSPLRAFTLNFPHQKSLQAVPQNVPNESNQIAKCDEEKKSEIFNNINKLLKTNTEGRLFAVVQLCGKQFKITAGDIILVEGYWPPTIGDKLRLDKVLLAGANDFTLIGRPILKPGLCDVQATIIEKTLTHTKTHFKKKRRKQFMRINFYRSPNTMIRINSIRLSSLDDDTNNISLQNEKIF